MNKPTFDPEEETLGDTHKNFREAKDKLILVILLILPI